MRKTCLIIFLAFAAIMAQGQENRSFDGTNNNLFNVTWGAAGSEMPRLTDVYYSDLISTPAGQNRPNPRKISNDLFDQKDNVPDQLALSDYVWVFGQFVDHDISIVSDSHTEVMDITMPDDEKVFGPQSVIRIGRSSAMEGTGTDLENPRQYVNDITSFVDGSQIYGSDIERATWLRSMVDGKLKTSTMNLLPWNTVTGEFNSSKDLVNSPFMGDDTRSGTKLFVAGDIRANENPLLMSLHIIWVREHNRTCDILKKENPSWTDDELYFKARKLVIGKYQSIVFNEWLPSMGVSLPEYIGYQDDMDPSILNVFSAAAFRLGHTLINSNIIRMNNDGDEISRGNISLRDSYFNPAAIILAGGIEPYFKGMATQIQQEMDCKVIDDVRNFLFGQPGAGGLDLAAININRGRDRGLPDYNTIRANFGLPTVSSFEAITNDPEDAESLRELYGDVNSIDPWVGMLAEKHMPNALFGELVMTIMEEQFRRLRDGDRYFYENDDSLSEAEKTEIRNSTLQHVIMRNSDIEIMQERVFEAMPHDQIPNGPDIAQRHLSSAVYPNPTNDQVIIKLFVEEETEMTLVIFDQKGQRVFSDTKLMPAGENFMQYRLGDRLPQGLYNVCLEAGYTFKIMRLFME